MNPTVHAQVEIVDGVLKHVLCLQFVVENMVGVHGMMNYVDARTQFFDEIVTTALNEGICQVVVLAAGYDTRPYRLCRPSVKVSALQMFTPIQSADMCGVLSNNP